VTPGTDTTTGARGARNAWRLSGAALLAPAALVLLALVAAGCGGGPATTAAPAPAAKPAKRCPAAARAGWQQLADRVGAPVYCPTWMPPPLDSEIDGAYKNVSGVDPDRSYLVSLLFLDRDAGGVTGEVHVNFRGYPGSGKIPTCEDTRTDKGQVTRVKIPCFSDARGTKRVGGELVTVYTVNQGIDQWHVLYAWRHGGSLYTVSQHVIEPYTFARVVKNLDRVMRGLVRLEPRRA
jgi:hypothetical protein